MSQRYVDCKSCGPSVEMQSNGHEEQCNSEEELGRESRQSYDDQLTARCHVTKFRHPNLRTLW
jgi:hypothetical protein